MKNKRQLTVSWSLVLAGGSCFWILGRKWSRSVAVPQASSPFVLVPSGSPQSDDACKHGPLLQVGSTRSGTRAIPTTDDSETGGHGQTRLCLWETPRRKREQQKASPVPIKFAEPDSKSDKAQQRRFWGGNGRLANNICESASKWSRTSLVGLESTAEQCRRGWSGVWGRREANGTGVDLSRLGRQHR